jgi:hypothetical protein
MLAWPNPAQSYVQVGFGQALREEGLLEVHDLSGRLVGQWPLQIAAIGYGIDVHDWPNGVYTATLRSNNRIIGSVKLVVAH